MDEIGGRQDNRINKLQGFYLLEKLDLKHPDWRIVRIDIADSIIQSLSDNEIYTVRTAIEATKKRRDFYLPRMVGVTGGDVKEKFSGFKKNFSEEMDEDINVYVIIYPYFNAEFSGNALLIFESNPINSSKTIIVESCKGSLWNLTDHGIVDYKAKLVLDNLNKIINEESDIPNWDLLKEYLVKAVKKLGGLVNINERTEFLLEWSFVKQNNDFLFYELKTV